MTSVLGAVAFILLLAFAIGFHEFGHYSAARWAGVKVRQFFIGFGPTLWSIRRGVPEKVTVDSSGAVVDGAQPSDAGVRVLERPETEFGVKLLPLGGYVRIAGMSPFEEVRPDEHSRSFRAAPIWKRAVILSAGSFTHAITAFVVLMVIFCLIGLPGAPTLRVDAVQTELADGAPAPAFAAGIRPGDTFVEVDGAPVRRWEDVRDRIRARPGVAVSVTVRGGDGATRSIRVTPAIAEDNGERIGLIGVAPHSPTERVNPVIAAGRSVGVMAMLAREFVRLTPRAFTPANLGLIPGREPGEDRALSIFGAGRVAARAANEGIAIFLFFYVSLNLFVGLFNMLPVLPLDGGHLLLLAIEKIRGRPVSQRVLGRALAVGFAVMAVLGVSLVVQDIIQPIPNLFEQ